MNANRRDSLLAFVGVQPGEGERVALMWLLSLVTVGGVVISGQVVGRALFLSGLPASAIPFRFIVPPIVLVATTAAYSARLARSQQHTRVMLSTLAALAAALFVGRLLVATTLRTDRLFLLALFSLLEIAGSLSMILFWTVAGSLFDPREARRLFGLISSGSTLANVAFGAFLAELARRLPPEELMWLVVASLLGCRAILGHLSRRYHGEPHEPAPERRATNARSPSSRPGLVATLHETLASPLVVSLSGIVLVVSIVANVTEYQLDVALKASYDDDGRGMIAFLARLRLVAGAVAFLVQFLIAGRLMERFGVLAALLLLPCSVAVGSAAIVLSSGALWAVAVPRAADVALKYSVNDSAFNLLFLPLAPRFRSRAKALIEGMVKPPLTAALGLAFLGANLFAPVSLVQLSIPVLALVALWALLLVRAERHYVHALAQSIVLRRLDPNEDTLALSDETSARVMAGALADPNPAKVIHALTLLGGAAGRDWSPQVGALLRHANGEVRAAALDYLAERPSDGLATEVRACMGDGQEPVRAAAVRAYGRALGPRAVAEIAARLGDASIRVRAAAVASLVQYGGLGGFLRASRPFHAMLESPDPAERREGARVLGVLGVASFYDPLLGLICDPDRGVRLAAIEAAERIATPELVPVLIKALEDASTRARALHAIGACSGGDPAVLADLLLDRSRPPELRCQVAGSLARLGPRAASLLASALDEPDDRVRGAVVSALVALREEDGRVPLDPGRLSRRLLEELRGAFDRWLCLRDLEDGGGHSPLLREALERATGRDRDCIIDLLVLGHSALDAAPLRTALARADSPRRAEAIELIDRVAVATRGFVVPYLAGTDAQRLEAAERLGGSRLPAHRRLDALTRGDDRWLRACALDAIGRRRVSELLPVVQAAAVGADALLAATARGALVRLGQAQAKEVPTMPLAPLEQVLFLKQVPLFRDIPGEEVAALLPIVERVDFAREETIIRQGDEGDCLFIIVEGEVAITIGGRRGEKIMGPRDVIGELAILTGEPRAATCTALSDVVAMRMRREPFWELMRERPEVSLGVIRILLDYLKGRDKGARSPDAGPERAERADPATTDE